MPKECPRCHTLGTTADTFCANCGTELDQAPTAAPAPEPEPEEEIPDHGGPGTGTRLGLIFLDLFPGVINFKVVVCSIIAMAFCLVALWVAMFLFTMGAMFTAFICGAGAIMVYWTVLGWLMTGDVMVPVEAMAEFQGKHWTVLIMATTIPIGLLFWVAKMVVAARGEGL